MVQGPGSGWTFSVPPNIIYAVRKSKQTEALLAHKRAWAPTELDFALAAEMEETGDRFATKDRNNELDRAG